MSREPTVGPLGCVLKIRGHQS